MGFCRQGTPSSVVTSAGLATPVMQTTGTPATGIIGNTFERTPQPVVTEAIAKGPARVTMRDNAFDGSVP